MKEGYRVGHLEPVNPNDPRGSTREWKFPDGHQITVYERYAGHKFGGHYHTGSDPSKRPERLYIITGSVRVRVKKDGRTDELILFRGDVFTIDPFVQHWMEALENTVLIEYRLGYFDPQNPDTVSVE